jgi:hypothetical protein
VSSNSETKEPVAQPPPSGRVANGQTPNWPAVDEPPELEPPVVVAVAEVLLPCVDAAPIELEALPELEPDWVEWKVAPLELPLAAPATLLRPQLAPLHPPGVPNTVVVVGFEQPNRAESNAIAVNARTRRLWHRVERAVKHVPGFLRTDLEG